MNSKIHEDRKNLFTYTVLCILGISLFILLCSPVITAVPEGAAISLYGNSTKIAQNGTARQDARGSINYLTLSATQQNQRWKGYVGNVTGTLVLQDSGGYNLYDWAVSTSLTGNVLASRNNTLQWSTLACTNLSGMTNEQAQLEFTNGTADNINSTFNSTAHTQFTIATINLNGCPTVYTFQNNTRQPYQSSSNVFQEISVMDNFTRVAYVTQVYQDIYSYQNSSVDFQLLLPDFGNLSNTDTATYYFFVELS